MVWRGKVPLTFCVPELRRVSFSRTARSCLPLNSSVSWTRSRRRTLCTSRLSSRSVAFSPFLYHCHRGQSLSRPSCIVHSLSRATSQNCQISVGHLHTLPLKIVTSVSHVHTQPLKTVVFTMHCHTINLSKQSYFFGYFNALPLKTVISVTHFHIPPLRFVISMSHQPPSHTSSQNCHITLTLHLSDLSYLSVIHHLHTLPRTTNVCHSLSRSSFQICLDVYQPSITFTL